MSVIELLIGHGLTLGIPDLHLLNGESHKELHA